MKKVLMMAIPALLAAGSVHAAEIYNKDGNKLDLYGKVDARHTFSDAKSKDGDATYVRLGFKGETQINRDLTGYGQWEYNIQGNKTEDEGADTATRLAFAGLNAGDAGTFDYGRNYGVIYDVVAITDMLPVFGGDSYSASDNFMTGRANGLATYRNSNFFGLVEGLGFALQYQGKNGAVGENINGRGKVLAQNGEGWGSSVSYDMPYGVSAVVAYSNSHRTGKQRTETFNDAKHAEAWATGLKYDANSVYLAANYAETRNMTAMAGSVLSDLELSAVTDKTKNLEVVAQYQFDSGLRPSIAYLQSKAQKDGYDYTQVKYIEAGATYYFNKNMSVYGDYKFNLLNKNNSDVKNLGLTTDNEIGIGAIYQF
ncbi:outer membrane protein n, non-specific porin [Citrobacter rodentium ICC168]|jgi:Outer membrane protein (porin)|uniref:Outer membrane protein n, non-specific porin n=2 Tax=Citrobacter rodentium TaxID=67825 RepID=D2TI85_CITRI|nr:porin [Citrobacter rodentium]CBG86982.1 outer membrane protein n, non-specific porin [Citrobacter rodentium ICC168]